MPLKKNEILINSFISGKSDVPPDPTGGWQVNAPYCTDLTLGKTQFAYSQIDRAIAVTKENQKRWKAKTFEERKAILLESLAHFILNKEKLLKVLTSETGRPEHDVDLEWKEVEKWVKEFSAHQFSMLEARGLVAVVGSYVWPIYHSTQFVFISLLLGNGVLLKPSEKTTLSVLEWGKIFFSGKGGFDLSGLLQILVGEREFSRRLCCHDQINAVIFMGSYEAGIRIQQDTLSQTQKEVLLFLGAKNASIVCEDAPAESVNTLIDDAFLSAGQHCKSVSQIFIHESRWSSWLDSFHSRAKQFKIGGPDTDAWMGPLLDESMIDRYIKFCGISEREGAEAVMRGKVLGQSKKAYLVTPTIVTFQSLTPEQIKKSVSLQTEILSPHVTLIKFKNYDEVVALCNQSHYGLCASIWSEHLERASAIASQLEVGEVRINQSTLLYSPGSSFQAKKKSGNHAYHGFNLWNQLGLMKQTHIK